MTTAKARTCPMCGYVESTFVDPRAVFEKRSLARMAHSDKHFCEVLVKLDGQKRQVCKTCMVTALRAALRAFTEE